SLSRASDNGSAPAEIRWRHSTADCSPWPATDFLKHGSRSISIPTPRDDTNASGPHGDSRRGKACAGRVAGGRDDTFGFRDPEQPSASARPFTADEPGV